MNKLGREVLQTGMQKKWPTVQETVPGKHDQYRSSRFSARSLFIGLAVIALCVLACTTGTREELVLFDFESDAELDQLHWTCHTLYSLSDRHATHGARSIKLELYPSDYPGLTMKLTTHNWRRHKSLQFDVYNPGDKVIPIGVRIDDRKDFPDYHDRYNKRFDIIPGANRIAIPLDPLMTSGSLRHMDLRKISTFLIFTDRPAAKTVLYIDYIRLT